MIDASHSRRFPTFHLKKIGSSYGMRNAMVRIPWAEFISHLFQPSILSIRRYGGDVSRRGQFTVVAILHTQEH